MVDFADISLLDVLHKLPPGGHPDMRQMFGGGCLLLIAVRPLGSKPV